MFLDFREHPRDQLIETDVCVIGAGAAGIAIADALAHSSLDVCLLETGGMSQEMVYMQLTAPAMRKGDYLTAGCRPRYFGGATNHWGGQSIPLEERDFERREWVAQSGWPISRADLDDWYAQANRLVGGGLYEYSKAGMQDANWPYPELKLEFFDDIYFRRSQDPTGIANPYKESFQSAPNIRVYLHATATMLHANAAASNTRAITIKEPGGNQARLQARYFVISAGALESTRLLLASNDVVPAGLGNQGDQVGRYFMMHPHINIGRVVNPDERLLKYFKLHEHGGADVVAGIRPSFRSQKEQEILNASVRFTGMPDRQSGYYAMGEATRELEISRDAWEYGFEYELREDFDDLVWLALKDFDSVVRGGWERLWDEKYEGEFLRTEADIYVQSEQAPNPASRITLGEDMDSLGVPRMVQDCRILPIDKRTLRVTGELLGQDLALQGFGRVKLGDWLLDDSIEWDRTIWGGCHHMGTTRMSATDADGVVDSDCRLHSVDNTFVASGGVFSTGGYANPTLSIVALALRLSDHIKALQ
jgi:choline dehydrogenase-like flavoprotein